MKKYLGGLLLLGLFALVLSGCGTLRALTTRHLDFNYAVPDAINLTSPVSGVAVTTSSVTITGDLVNKFDKYHGGIDWAGLTYTATATASPLASGSPFPTVDVKFYASLQAPTGSFPNIQIPSDATLIEQFILSPDMPSITRDSTADSSNPVLRDYLEKILRENTGGDKKVYLYFQVSSTEPGNLKITNLAVKGSAHGSLF